MFEVNQTYANRKGRYTVQAILEDGDKMRVQYEDGTVATLRTEIQMRIWDNIISEQEKTAIANARKQTNQYYIKAVSLTDDATVSDGWQARVVLALDESLKLKQGARLIYYAIEYKAFFAVVTITGDGTEADPEKYFYTIEQDTAFFYPIDSDALLPNPQKGVTSDSVELDSQPNFNKMKLAPEQFIAITEDDFELLAEQITEITEGEPDDDDDLDDDDYLEDEI